MDLKITTFGDMPDREYRLALMRDAGIHGRDAETCLDAMNANLDAHGVTLDQLLTTARALGSDADRQAYLTANCGTDGVRAACVLLDDE